MPKKKNDEKDEEVKEEMVKKKEDNQYCVHFPQENLGHNGFDTINKAYEWAIQAIKNCEYSNHFEIGNGYYDPMNPEWIIFHSLYDNIQDFKDR